MSIPLYVVDAFTSTLFHGNPAGVCLLENWLPDDVLEGIAAENNLPETAFLVAQREGWHLRWFTPTVEIPLCGHATLASAFVLNRLYPDRERFDFHTLSGDLSVTCNEGLFTLDFPARTLEAASVQQKLDVEGALAQSVVALTRAATTLIAELVDENAVQSLQPNLPRIAALDCSGLIITARGTQSDFVSRFFAPSIGIDEDPVTGSAHCGLVPYWSEKLGRKHLHARQLSKRGGEIFCNLREDRVLMSGHAVLYSRGEIYPFQEEQLPDLAGLQHAHR